MFLLFCEVFRSYLSKKKEQKARHDESRLVHGQHNTVSKLHVQLRKIGRCTVDLLNRWGLGWPSSYIHK